MTNINEENEENIAQENITQENLIEEKSNNEETQTPDLNSKNESELQIEKLNKDLSQSQMRYVELYNNYKIVEKQLDDYKSNQKKDRIFFALKEMSQIINNLYNFINSLSDDLKNNESVKWLVIAYENYIKSLESKNIYIVKSLGETPNEMHDVIAMQEATDYDKKMLTANGINIENLSGKIINQFEVGFYYESNGIKELIKSAKVIVGA